MDWTGTALPAIFVAGAIAAHYLGAHEIALLLTGAVVGQQLPSVRRAK